MVISPRRGGRDILSFSVPPPSFLLWLSVYATRIGGGGDKAMITGNAFPGAPSFGGQTKGKRPTSYLTAE